MSSTVEMIKYYFQKISHSGTEERKEKRDKEKKVRVNSKQSDF
jgi:hypothetical protein